MSDAYKYNTTGAWEVLIFDDWSTMTNGQAVHGRTPMYIAPEIAGNSPTWVCDFGVSLVKDSTGFLKGATAGTETRLYIDLGARYDCLIMESAIGNLNTSIGFEWGILFDFDPTAVDGYYWSKRYNFDGAIERIDNGSFTDEGRTAGSGPMEVLSANGKLVRYTFQAVDTGALTTRVQCYPERDLSGDPRVVGGGLAATTANTGKHTASHTAIGFQKTAGGATDSTVTDFRISSITISRRKTF